LGRFKAVKQVVDDELPAGNGTMPRLGVIREVWVEDDPGRARWFRRRYEELWHHYAGIANADSPFQTDATARKVTVEDTGTGPGATQDPMELADMAIIGSADEVIDRLWEFIDAGADTLVFHVRVGGMPTAALRENLRRLATAVIPSGRKVVR
jgi:alkanesulfonate monooxygenase SsuD/methylene tetrahydromethanopterin reductase-like flavin-dependent oxidoreductase (luciferase family)